MSERAAIDLTCVVSRVNDNPAATLDGEVVLLGMEQEKYYWLTGVARRIWELLERPIAVSGLVDQLLLEFAIARPECEADVLAFLGQLSAERLLRIEPSGPA